ncbi:MAG: class I SAM-dependent methyltransferase [Actinomycetota bacterium]|nr:class I SAM-dependent methyltransferase [Actinomycetota bacterium]
MADRAPQPVYGLARQGWRTRLAERVAGRARRRRRELFRRLMTPVPGERILDVGSGETGLAGLEPELDVTGTDRVERPEYPGPFVRADARELPFADGEFDVAYSNSVIEHVVEPSDRRALTAELARVGGRYFVQTPNRFFPVEPHALLPLVHWLPRRLGRRLWNLGVSEDPFDDTLLLDAGHLRELFPDAIIVRERLGPFTKSLVAAGPADKIERGRSSATRLRGSGSRRGWS